MLLPNKKREIIDMSDSDIDILMSDLKCKVDNINLLRIVQIANYLEYGRLLSPFELKIQRLIETWKESPYNIMYRIESIILSIASVIALTILCLELILLIVVLLL